MRLEWVKQQLVRGGTAAAAAGAAHNAAPRRGTAVSTPNKTSAYVIAESMEPSGCSCVLVTSRKARHQQDSPPPSSSSAHARHRVVLPGITPGTILRTRQSVVAWIRASRQLPAPDQYTIVMRDGRRILQGSSAVESLPTLPCRRASACTCSRCPWMALQVRQQSSSAKHKAWRTSLLGEVRNAWSASSSSAQGGSSGSSDPAAAISAAQRAPAYPLRRISFLEPLTVPVVSNQLQALQLRFQPRTQQNDQVGSAAAAAAGFLDPSPHCTPTGNTAALRPGIELVREGSVRSSTCSGNISNSDGEASGNCLLETLEQQRLVPFLERWANLLPTTVQSQLRGVFISQPTRSSSSRGVSSSSSAQARTSLQLALVVERDTNVLGMQSPLCGPAHPADLLSIEEQQLVAAVTAAAPLVTDIELLVCIGGANAGTSKGKMAIPEVAVDVLYPQLSRREVSMGQLQLHPREAEAEGADKTLLPAHAPSLVVRCWCEPLGRELQARLPPYHAALSALPAAWLVARKQERGGVRVSSPSHDDGSALAWVPTFWRHPEALNLCCSAVLSLLLEELKGGAEVDDNVGSATTRVSASRKDFLSTVVVTPRSFTAAAVDVTAFTGQRVLDAALRQMVAETLAAASDAVNTQGARAALETVDHSPRRLVVSVDEDASHPQVPAEVEEALCAVAHFQSVRVLLYTCTTQMSTERIGALSALIMQRGIAAGSTTSVCAGVIDVDPLSSSYVAYAQVDLTPECQQ